MKKRIVASFLIFLLISSCTKDVGKLPFCESNSSKFNSDIKPILITKCAISGCHEPGFVLGNFNNYSDVKLKVDKGSFYNFIYVNKLMPPSGREPLSETELKKIKCWLDDGAPEN